MIVMSESSRHDEPRTWWKEMIKRRIVALFSAALVGGQRHAEYLVELGMPREQVFIGYDAVDNDYFGRRTAEIRNAKFEVRNKRGLPANYFLASARFIEKKNLSTLIEAYAEYRRRSSAFAKARRTRKSRRKCRGIWWSWVMVRCGKLSSPNFRLST